MFRVFVVICNSLCWVCVFESLGCVSNFVGNICFGRLQSCLKLCCLVIVSLLVVNSYFSVCFFVFQFYQGLVCFCCVFRLLVFSVFCLCIVCNIWWISGCCFWLKCVSCWQMFWLLVVWCICQCINGQCFSGSSEVLCFQYLNNWW